MSRGRNTAAITYENNKVMNSIQRRKVAAAALLAILDYERKKNNRKKRRIWTRKWLARRKENRCILSMLFEELGPEDPRAFHNFTRMDDAALQELLELVTPLITKCDTVMREAIPAHHRLAATLLFLATGNSFQDLAYSTRIAPNTLSKLIVETLTAIVSVLEQEKVIDCPSSPFEWEAVAGQFHAQWQFPHCIGAMDGKHINFKPPRSEGSRFRNYKGQDSIVLFALANANYKFLYVDVGCNGRMHDASVFRESSLSQHLLSGSLNLPAPCPLPGKDIPVPYVITADDAFPLKENIMKPYPGRGLTHEKRVFNYRLSRARRVIENVFGILANRFRILLKVIPLSVEKVELIVWACCLLHNFLLNRNAQWYNPAECQKGNGQADFQNVVLNGGNRPSNNATMIRNNFTSYFISSGAVPWQDNSVAQGDY